LVHHSRIIP